MLKTTEEAYLLLESLGAPQRLITHVKLVGEAAEELISKLKSLDIEFEDNIVRLGVSVHDAGKIIHPEELDSKGTQHEASGEILLLDAGVQPEVARCSLSHARYSSMDISFEELLVALSDKLWKGKRDSTLELEIIDNVAELMGKKRWDIFIELDECFEQIASKGSNRLARSISE